MNIPTAVAIALLFMAVVIEGVLIGSLLRFAVRFSKGYESMFGSGLHVGANVGSMVVALHDGEVTTLRRISKDRGALIVFGDLACSSCAGVMEMLSVHAHLVDSEILMFIQGDVGALREVEDRYVDVRIVELAPPVSKSIMRDFNVVSVPSVIVLDHTASVRQIVPAHDVESYVESITRPSSDAIVEKQREVA